MKAKVWDYSIKGFKEVDAIGILKYEGESFFAFIDGKEYIVLGIENRLLRVFDESEEDYLYEIDNPRPMDGSLKGGKWKIIKDEYGKLKDIMT